MSTCNDEPPSDSASPAAWSTWAKLAADDEDWVNALVRWECCIEKFGPRPEWRAQKAACLLRLEELAEAERIYTALARNFPDRPLGLIGLASVALSKEDWEGALSIWTECFERFPKHVVPAWVDARARALRRLGRPQEAETLLLQALQQIPEHRQLKVAAVLAAIDTCKMTDTLEGRRLEFRNYIVEQFDSASDAGSRIQAVRLFDALDEFEQSSRSLLNALQYANTIKELFFCFRAIPAYIERGSRGPLWQLLLERLRSRQAARGISDGLRATDLELRLLLALERFPEYLECFDATGTAFSRTKDFRLFQSVFDRLSRPRAEIFAEPKVFGVGLSKTATTSLSKALKILGIDVAHWSNPLTLQLVTEIDVYMFGACTDASVAQDFEKLYYLYPNAKFVWTQRPVDSWIRSFVRHHGKKDARSATDELRIKFGKTRSRHGFGNSAILFGLYLNAANLEDAYSAFDARVRSFFSGKPPERLLAFDVFSGHGWTELCNFLDLSVPDQAFPWLHKKDQGVFSI
jgi:tetratricopeptide (TPR) repeat protein